MGNGRSGKADAPFGSKSRQENNDAEDGRARNKIQHQVTHVLFRDTEQSYDDVDQHSQQMQDEIRADKVARGLAHVAAATSQQPAEGEDCTDEIRRPEQQQIKVVMQIQMS